MSFFVSHHEEQNRYCAVINNKVTFLDFTIHQHLPLAAQTGADNISNAPVASSASIISKPQLVVAAQVPIDLAPEGRFDEAAITVPTCMTVSPEVRHGLRRCVVGFDSGFIHLYSNVKLTGPESRLPPISWTNLSSASTHNHHVQPPNSIRDGVETVTWVPQMSAIVACYSSNKMGLISLDSGSNGMTVKNTFTAPQLVSTSDWLDAIQWCLCGSAQTNGNVYAFDPRSKSFAATFQKSAEYVCCHPTESLFATFSRLSNRTGQVVLWDARQPSQPMQIRPVNRQFPRNEASAAMSWKNSLGDFTLCLASLDDPVLRFIKFMPNFNEDGSRPQSWRSSETQLLHKLTATPLPNVEWASVQPQQLQHEPVKSPRRLVSSGGANSAELCDEVEGGYCSHQPAPFRVGLRTGAGARPVVVVLNPVGLATIIDPVPSVPQLAWSPSGELFVSHSCTVYRAKYDNSSLPSAPPSIPDPSLLMAQRLQSGFGVSSQRNLAAAERDGDDVARTFWRYVSLMQQAHVVGTTGPVPGIISLVGGSIPSLTSLVEQRVLPQHHRCQTNQAVNDPRRLLILEALGWLPPLEPDDLSFSRRDDVEKHAAIYIFHGMPQHAAKLLMKHAAIHPSFAALSILITVNYTSPSGSSGSSSSPSAPSGARGASSSQTVRPLSSLSSDVSATFFNSLGRWLVAAFAYLTKQPASSSASSSIPQPATLSSSSNLVLSSAANSSVSSSSSSTAHIYDDKNLDICDRIAAATVLHRETEKLVSVLKSVHLVELQRNNSASAFLVNIMLCGMNDETQQSFGQRYVDYQCDVQLPLFVFSRLSFAPWLETRNKLSSPWGRWAQAYKDYLQGSGDLNAWAAFEADCSDVFLSSNASHEGLLAEGGRQRSGGMFDGATRVRKQSVDPNAGVAIGSGGVGNTGGCICGVDHFHYAYEGGSSGGCSPCSRGGDSRHMPTCSVCLERVRISPSSAVFSNMALSSGRGEGSSSAATPPLTPTSPNILLPSSPHPGNEAAAGASDDSASSSWLSFCSSCMHGGHLVHLRTWFAKHQKCPIPGCRCFCHSDAAPFKA